MTKLYKSFKWLFMVLLLCISIVSWSQSKTVSGKVTSSDDGTALPGVNILEKGTTNGAVTDANGEFTVSVGSNPTLLFSFVGFETQEVVVGSQSTINIVLKSDVATLSEIVVVGYGEVQKKDVTGAVVAMSNKDFNKGVLTAPQDLITGKFAGVTVTSSSGAPSSGTTIRIRGGSSLNASNDPLIVIDGYPVDNLPATGAGSIAGVPNALASLNPNDIETFTILKDASATAIYGSRASNGVIIITTKRGKAGKLQLNYTANISVSKPVKFVDMMNAAEYRALVDELAVDGISGIDNAAKLKLGTADTDWQKEVYRTAISQDHNINISGAVAKIPYRVSYGYTDQQGILKNTGFQRNSLNINLNPSLLHDALKLNLSVKGSFTNTNFGDAAAVGNAVSFDPTQPVRDRETAYGGYFSWLKFKNPDGTSAITSGTSNPVAMLEQTDNKAEAKRIIANAQAEYRLPFFKAVKATLNVGMDRVNSEGHNRAPLNAGFVHSTGTLTGRDNIYDAENGSELLDFYVDYSKQLGSHKIDLTAGYGWQHFYREASNTDKNTLQTVDNGSKSENFLVSFFGRLNYNYNGKYLLTATLRQDGSSRFSKENRWGLFPAAALAWKLKEENFFAPVTVLSDLKLRIGYGVTGQQEIPGQYYPYLPVYRQSNLLARYQLGDEFYVTQRPEPYDANIKWEETTTYNAGIDFGFFTNRLTGSVEVFQKDTKDLLNRVRVANGSGFSNFLFTNVGSMKNQGIEVTLNGVVVDKGDFTWNVGLNLTSINSKITKLNLTDDPSYPGVFFGGIGVGANIQNNQVGQRASSFFPYQQVYNESGRPVEGLYADISGNGGSVVGSDDNKYHYKTPNAKFLIGLNSRLRYKQIDFSFSSRLSLGNYVYNNVESGRAFYNGVYNLGYFQNIPKMVTDTDFINQQIYSDYYVQDASFFKMDNISAGYNFERLFTDRLKARLSLTVTNAFIVTDYKGLDPEVDGGIDNNIYPRPRTFLLGINVTF